MAESEEVVSRVVAEAGSKCGSDLPEPDCNGNNTHHNDLDNSYVFVNGGDVVNKDVVVEGLLRVEDHASRLISHNEKLQSMEVDGNVERSNDDHHPVVVDTKSDHSPLGCVEIQESEIRVSDLVVESGDNGGDANDAYGNQINNLRAVDTSEACQGSQDVVEDEVKLAGGVVESAEHQVSSAVSVDLDLESNLIDRNDQTGLAVDLGVVAEDEVKLSEEVVETAEHEVPLSASVDLGMESNPINTEEETDVGVDVVGCELQDVSVKAKDEVKLLEGVVEVAEREVPSSASLEFESNPVNIKEEIDVVAGVVECELQDAVMKAEDEVKLSGDVVEIEVPSSTSLELESNPINIKEEADAVASGVDCALKDASVKAEDEVKLSGEVVEISEHKFPSSTSSELDLESNPLNTKEEKDMVADVIECGLKDSSMGPEDELKLAREVVETAEQEVPSSTSLELESNPINTKEETDVVASVGECELHDASVKAEDEVKLSVEVVKIAEHEVPPSTSSEMDLESNAIYTKEETDVVADVVECELKDLSAEAEDNMAETTLSLDVLEDQQCDIAPGNDDQSVLVQIDEAKTVENVSDLVLEGKNEDILVSHIDNGVQYPEELDKRTDSCGVSLETMQSETKTDASEPSRSLLTSNAHAPQTEIEISEAETTGAVDAVVLIEKEPVFQGGEACAEAGVPSGKGEVPNSSENCGDLTLTCRTEGSDSSSVEKEGAANIELEINDVEDAVDQTDGAAGSSNENLMLGENEDIGNSQHERIPVASPGGSNVNMIDREEASKKTKRKPFNFLIRVPRFDDEKLREQIKLAKLNVDEKTRLRDSIQVQIQEKRANSQIHGIDYEYAKGEGRSVRKLVRSKRMEIDSLQSVINKAKNALSIEDIDSQIYNMEHMIQHETLPLKEEKQLIREIKQLKQLREQLSSNMGSKDEIKQALEQREDVEERLKVLRKELDILKDKVLKAEAVAVEAEKKYDDENKKVRELQAQFRAADDVRQAAYAQWHSLRQELTKKSNHFYKYKDDATAAGNYVFSRDTEGLYDLCMNNVEDFMKLWNTNDEFRKEYVKFNTRSTVRRFGTLDGRSLGPNEEPLVLPSYVDERFNRNFSKPVKVDLASQFPTLELKQERTIGSVTSDGNKILKEATEEKNQKVTSKTPAISVQVNDSDAVSGEKITNEVHEEPKKSREEIEAIKKAEEKEREENEAKLKEQRRLEALAKANEARERKKRQAEKLQMRAELKTIKEAEQKEKEREKRIRKKERKKAAATDVNDVNDSEIAPNSESTVETSKEVEAKDVSSTVAPKKPKKHWLFAKQTKTKSIPPPLRNRNKKKLQQWMWVGMTCAVILILFWLGNIGVFSNVNLKRRSPVI